MNSATTPIQVYNVEEIYSRHYPQVSDVLTELLVIGAVSGVGRSTVGKIIQQALGSNVGVMRNFTTRRPRPEDESDRLIFGNRSTLAARMARGEVLFYVDWAGNGEQYALLKSELTRIAEFDRAIFETTHFGWPIKAQNPRLVTNVWLTCADSSIIRGRLAARGTESIAEQDQRVRSAINEQAYILARKDELIQQGKVDAVIEVSDLSVNDVVLAVVNVLREKMRPSRETAYAVAGREKFPHAVRLSPTPGLV